MSSETLTAPSAVRLGLAENWRQFSLLVLVNAFVGGMVGLERTVVPLVGAHEFRIASTTLVTSFIVSFGVVKAFANLVSGHLADVYGRKALLIAGWLFGLPAPFMIGWGPSWGWIVAANVLLGLNQGFAWSMTVIMKVDLVGPKSRGLAVGLNEFAGYVALGLTALVTGYIAQRYGLRPAPFYLGIAYAVLGLGLSVLVVRDTRAHVALELAQHPRPAERVRFLPGILIVRPPGSPSTRSTDANLRRPNREIRRSASNIPSGEFCGLLVRRRGDSVRWQ